MLNISYVKINEQYFLVFCIHTHTDTTNIFDLSKALRLALKCWHVEISIGGAPGVESPVNGYRGCLGRVVLEQEEEEQGIYNEACFPLE